ncbi:hypothetical protein [Aliarcobacter butzleri]|uniref:hypothetical protein n=1 Tax=Aliarcobacter butzleri TaxID=28197 RepID=UPI0011654C58|nr:hypothetical protein [Aliarcobacter butzleri]QDM00819.1 hypothetical protein FM022_02910 [Aliarcobacter butzleri]
MSKTKKLFGLCLNQDLNVSLSWQKITDWTVEIYVGYRTNYRNIFYGQSTSKKEVLKEAIDFMKNFSRKEWQSKVYEDKRMLKASDFEKKYKDPTLEIEE